MNSFFGLYTTFRNAVYVFLGTVFKKKCHVIVKYCIFGGVIFIWGSCRTVKQSQSHLILSKKKASFLLEQHKANQIEFSTFIGKAKIKYKSKEENLGMQALIRIQKDSAIYLSITKMGFEGLRTLITPDSVHILNRQTKEYYGFSFLFLEENYHLRLNFNELQNLIIGNIAFHSTELKTGIEKGLYWLADESNKLFLRPENYLVSVFEYYDKQMNIGLNAVFEDFKPIENKKQSFPYHQILTLNTKDEENTFLDINYSDISFSKPPKISFHIPETYERK